MNNGQGKAPPGQLGNNTKKSRYNCVKKIITWANTIQLTAGMIFDDKKNKLDVGDTEALGGSATSSIDLQVSDQEKSSSSDDDSDFDDEENEDDEDDKEEKEKEEEGAEAEILGAEGEEDQDEEDLPFDFRRSIIIVCASSKSKVLFS
eukprot:SAG11_NODE_330_length_10677_cov_8.535117_7_plen_148_part_00